MKYLKSLVAASLGSSVLLLSKAGSTLLADPANVWMWGVYAGIIYALLVSYIYRQIWSGKAEK